MTGISHRFDAQRGSRRGSLELRDGADWLASHEGHFGRHRRRRRARRARLGHANGGPASIRPLAAGFELEAGPAGALRRCGAHAQGTSWHRSATGVGARKARPDLVASGPAGRNGRKPSRGWPAKCSLAGVFACEATCCPPKSVRRDFSNPTRQARFRRIGSGPPTGTTCGTRSATWTTLFSLRINSTATGRHLSRVASEIGELIATVTSALAWGGGGGFIFGQVGPVAGN